MGSKAHSLNEILENRGTSLKKRVHLKLGHNPRMPTITSDNRVGREDGQKHDSRFCQTIQSMHSRLTFLRVSSVVFHDKLLRTWTRHQSKDCGRTITPRSREEKKPTQRKLLKPLLAMLLKKTGRWVKEENRGWGMEKSVSGKIEGDLYTEAVLESRWDQRCRKGPERSTPVSASAGWSP